MVELFNVNTVAEENALQPYLIEGFSEDTESLLQEIVMEVEVDDNVLSDDEKKEAISYLVDQEAKRDIDKWRESIIQEVDSETYYSNILCKMHCSGKKTLRYINNNECVKCDQHRINARSELKMSVMTGKMQGIPALNTSPLDNPFCKIMSKNKNVVCGSCYSNRSLRRFGYNVREKFRRNGVLMSTSLLSGVDIPDVNANYIRIHAHGEILNKIHFLNILLFSLRNENSTVALWTKRKDIVSPLLHLIPKNLILVYSEPLLNPTTETIPKGFDKIFSVYTKEFVKKNTDVEINCGSRKCMECLRCYKKDNGVNYIRELRK